MGTKQSTVDFYIDQMEGAGSLSFRKMFGEYALYCDGKVVGLICDDRLFIKISDISPEFLDMSHNKPPYPGAKNYLLVPEDRIEDTEWLRDFIRRTADVLPFPKSKSKLKRK